MIKSVQNNWSQWTQIQWTLMALNKKMGLCIICDACFDTSFQSILPQKHWATIHTATSKSDHSSSTSGATITTDNKKQSLPSRSSREPQLHNLIDNSKHVNNQWKWTIKQKWTQHPTNHRSSPIEPGGNKAVSLLEPFGNNPNSLYLFEGYIYQTFEAYTYSISYIGYHAVFY